jgi:SpoVK/Ycf46/Vps4 family AAA+-type ATPase
MFRQMAQETRQSVVAAEGRNLAFSSAGVLVWFSGSSGTGKTMAAEVVARELRTNLYRVNLNQIVSQYIGETEKNLTRVFETAQKKSAVLLFDEADALFGKRSEVKDSHDRYANIEVSYLLSKIEAYRGLVILTTNRKVDIDPSVMCRVKYLLEFSPPLPTPRVQHRQ